MRHIKMFEGFLHGDDDEQSDNVWVSLDGIEGEQLEELFTELDQAGIDFEDPGLTGNSSMEILSKVTPEQVQAIRVKFPQIASQLA